MGHIEINAETNDFHQTVATRRATATFNRGIQYGADTDISKEIHQ